MSGTRWFENCRAGSPDPAIASGASKRRDRAIPPYLNRHEFDVRGTDGRLGRPRTREPRVPSVAFAAIVALLFVLTGIATPSARAAEAHGGAVASPASSVATRTLLLDAARAGNAVFAVGERGVIVSSDDAARSWTVVPTSVEATLTGITFGDPTLGWAVGHDGLILATHDGGRTWAKQWQSENLQDSFLDVVAPDARHVIAIGAFSLYVSTADGGATWVRRKIADGDYHFNRIVVATRNWSRDALVAPHSKRDEGVAASTTLYIAGEHGTLLRSLDAGASWQALHVPYEGSLYGVLPLKADELLAYGLRGRVFHSDDNGEHWTPVSTNESWLIATGVRLSDGSVVLAGNGRTLLVSPDPRRNFVARDVDAPAAIAELLSLPDGALLAVGEAGAERIELRRISPHPPPDLEPPAPPRSDTK